MVAKDIGKAEGQLVNQEWSKNVTIPNVHLVFDSDLSSSRGLRPDLYVAPTVRQFWRNGKSRGCDAFGDDRDDSYNSLLLRPPVGYFWTAAHACIAISASLYIYGSVNSVGLLLVLGSTLLGFGWGLTYSLGPIVLTRLVKPEERVQFFALLSVFVMAGFGLTPVLAYGLEVWGFSMRTPFHLTAILCLISAVLFSF